MKPGERIKELRLAKGYKVQKDFGDVIGYSDAYISEIETGKKEPSLDLLYTIEEKFGVSPATILWGLSRERWNAIKQIFQSEESPDDLFQKLTQLLRPPPAGLEYLQVSEPPLTYGGSAAHHENRQSENVPVRKFIDNVIKILNSGNEKIVTALESNVDAFLENIELSKLERKEGD